MRFLHPDGSTVHLDYCSNVHPAEDVEGIIDQIHRITGPVRKQLGTNVLGLGLWIAAAPAKAFLADPASLDRLKGALQEEQIEVVTLNAFPYGGFHDPVVKEKVFKPDWSEQERFDYTLDCARILTQLLPDDVSEGSISTMPFAYRSDSLTQGQDAFGRLAQELAALAQETGKFIRIAVEPEPGCIAENSAQVVAALTDVAPEWIGICLDACHMAVLFEDSKETVELVEKSGLKVFKSQVSSAVRSIDVASDRDRLETFVEPRFFHQTRERVADGTLLGVDDLPQALAGELPGQGEWRIHHHLPIHLSGDQTTQQELIDTLSALLGGDKALTHHLDAETYTWSVLPEELRPTDDASLIKGIATELAWTRDKLLELGLKEVS